MPNTIALAKNYTNILDEVYKNASVTADLISDVSMMRAGANNNEILYQQMEVGGLGDYDRNSGYTSAAVKLQWKTATFNYDRGAKIEVDVMDNEESRILAFTRAGATLQRERVAPEADAFTFATICGFDGITLVDEDLADAQAFLAALLVAKNEMDEAEVPEENRILYATPTLLNSVMALDTIKSREVLASFSVIKKVPQSRFYTSIDLLDGKSTGEEAGHFKKADDASEINFMVIHKPAISKFDKHIANDIIPASLNANADGDILKYRKYGLVDYYKNKAAGFYVSHKKTVTP